MGESPRADVSGVNPIGVFMKLWPRPVPVLVGEREGDSRLGESGIRISLGLELVWE
jgi:hypothetical protein